MGYQSIRIHKKQFLFTFRLMICLFILIEPVIFVFTRYHSFFRIGQLIVLFGCLIMLFKNLKQNFSIYVSIFFVYLLLVTYINNGAIIKVVTNFLPIFGLMLIIQASLKKNTFLTIKCLYYYFSIIIYINFFLLLSFPEGVLQVNTYQSSYVGYHFLGVTNQLAPYLLISAFISLIYFHINQKLNMGVIVHNICIYITIILTWSGTAVAWFTFFYILLFIANKFKRISNFLITWVKTGLSIFIVNLLIVVFHIQMLFSYFILQILQNDLTLSGRTVIWEKSLTQIANSILYGYGEIQNARYITVGTALFNAHNFFLQILLQGGILLFVIFATILITSIKKTANARNNTIKNYVLITILVFFSMMITEVYSFITIFLLLLITYNISYFIPDPIKVKTIQITKV